MEELIVTFQNKKDPALITPPMQVPKGITLKEMEELLNRLFSHDKTYAFFYNGTQINEMPEAAAETTLNIEFLAVSKISSESAKIDMDSPITCISIRRNPEVHTDSVVICTVRGETKEFSLGPGLDVLKDFDSFKPIRVVTSTETGLFVLTTTNKVVDVEKAEIVFEQEDPIRTITGCHALLAIGLASDEVVILEEGKEIKRIKTNGEIGKLILREVDDKYVLIAGIVTGTIEVYSGSDWNKTVIETTRPITAMGYEDGKIYVGGLGGSITICSLTKVEKEYQSDAEFISRIEAGTIFFVYTNKNQIHVRDKDNFTGTHLIELSADIADVKVSGKRLFVADGTSLKLFNIFDE
ncbi:hypothetical protein NEHOM01_1687 [Nematocida homosporus]|uniref:uncharacterized protein n=1 Tax=Nematocida homosporus TaxID=1912981 RepID=UPI00222074EE|nr:uncharacterized protein NEHOM01_1687 [Nematocida homosporus]KAI5186756.1 hypothetical protein NEHOM01_1687 [Nematocida homosporus]